jgi:hypothetical protein
MAAVALWAMVDNIVSKIICLAFKIIILVIFYAVEQYKTGSQKQAVNGRRL